MGKKQTIEALVEGGKATAGPPLGSSLGPLKVNVGAIVSEINKKTADFKGMKVPVKVIVDEETKAFEIEIGTPPTSQLIKTELGLEKGSGEPKSLKVEVIAIEQVIKVAKMKMGSMLVKNLKAAVKNVVGTCQQMGLLIDGKDPREIMKEIVEGRYDKEINSGITVVPKEKDFSELRKELQVKIGARKKEVEALKAAEAEKAAQRATEAGKPAAEAAAATTTAAKPAIAAEKKPAAAPAAGKA